MHDPTAPRNDFIMSNCDVDAADQAYLDSLPSAVHSRAAVAPLPFDPAWAAPRFHWRRLLIAIAILGCLAWAAAWAVLHIIYIQLSALLP